MSPRYRIENWKSVRNPFCQILTSELEMKRMCSAWLLHFLRMNEIQACFHACSKNLVMITNELEFLARVIITDKLWIHHHNPFLKKQLFVWLHQDKSWLKKVQQEKSAGKVTLIAFFDYKGMIYQHYCQLATRANKDYFVLVLDQLRIHIRREYPELVSCSILHQDKPLLHMAHLELKYLEKYNIWTMTHLEDVIFCGGMVNANIESCAWRESSERREIRFL